MQLSNFEKRQQQKVTVCIGDFTDEELEQMTLTQLAGIAGKSRTAISKRVKLHGLTRREACTLERVSERPSPNRMAVIAEAAAGINLTGRQLYDRMRNHHLSLEEALVFKPQTKPKRSQRFNPALF